MTDDATRFYCTTDPECFAPAWNGTDYCQTHAEVQPRLWPWALIGAISGAVWAVLR